CWSVPHFKGDLLPYLRDSRLSHVHEYVGFQPTFSRHGIIQTSLASAHGLRKRSLRLHPRGVASHTLKCGTQIRSGEKGGELFLDIVRRITKEVS
ncbi:MAG: hypothetical protein NC324_10645, partial [Bacteroides sp.]|nr:hypothetical protein [Bacteroides sp.]